MENGCVHFTGGLDRGGYGQVHGSNAAKKLKVTRAHQMAYAMTYGEYSKDFIICHKCDNPTCINPNHLFLGTWNDNIQDMMKKGRYKNELHPKVDYEEIYQYKNKETCFDVAKRFGISFSRVCQIWRKEVDFSRKPKKQGQKSSETSERQDTPEVSGVDS